MNIKLDRVHRFHIGEIIMHVDAIENDPANWITVEELTLRVVNGIAYPTYTISAKTYGQTERIPDVLDTEDLKPVLGDPFGRANPPESYEEAVDRFEKAIACCPYCKAPFTVGGIDHVVDCPATRHD